MWHTGVWPFNTINPTPLLVFLLFTLKIFGATKILPLKYESVYFVVKTALSAKPKRKHQTAKKTYAQLPLHRMAEIPPKDRKPLVFSLHWSHTSGFPYDRTPLAYPPWVVIDILL